MGMKLPAINLKSPQGYQIAKGEKTIIITPVKSLEYIDKAIYVISGDKILAKIALTKPLSTNHILFKSSYDKHLISEEERLKIWPKEKQFWSYHVKLLKSFLPPLYCGKMDKSGLFIKNVEPKKVVQIRIYNGKAYYTFKLQPNEFLLKATAEDIEEQTLSMIDDPSYKLFEIAKSFKKKWVNEKGKLVYKKVEA